MVDRLALLKDFASRGDLSKAFRAFSHIQSVACFDSIVESLCSLLLSCTNLKFFREGTQLHTQIILRGLHENHALVPKLVTYYTASDLLADAHFIVANSRMLHPLPWNVLISSYVSKGYHEDAILAYKQMCYKQINPDNFTYPSILKACAERSDLDFGREIHESINASSLNWNLFVQNALVSMYGKCGDLKTARTTFEKMEVKDDVSWNSIISGYASRDKWHEAFELFERMLASSVEVNIITWNTVAGGYLRTGNFKMTLELIRRMRIGGSRLDPISVIISLSACSHICATKLGKEIHGLAIRNSFVDYRNVKNSLITLYSRCGDLLHADVVFRSVEAPNIVTWNSIISGFAQWDRSDEAMFLLRELSCTGLEPNYVTLAGILPLCARSADLQHGKEFHCYILRHEEFQGYLLLWNSLIDMYARSGRVLTARKLFNLLDNRDEVTYTAMISGYGLQGDGKVAIQLFEEMIESQIKPDSVAMIAVLSACSHSGLVHEGQLLFEKMQNVYGVSPILEHFACMVDLFGRAGLLERAKDVILKMPYRPTSDMWATLIGACRIHGDTDIGEWAAEKLLEMKPHHSGYYVLIANMYAAAGSWSKLVEVRNFMRELGVMKDPGCAWVDVGGGFFRFLVDDTSYKMDDEVYELLGGLTTQMKDRDFVACRNIEDEEEIGAFL